MILCFFAFAFPSALCKSGRVWCGVCIVLLFCCSVVLFCCRLCEWLSVSVSVSVWLVVFVRLYAFLFLCLLVCLFRRVL